MGTHMKTTIDLSDALLLDAKRVAAREGTTVKALVESGLRHVLQQRRKASAPFRLRPAAFQGRGLRAELRDAGWDRLREMAYESRGG